MKPVLHVATAARVKVNGCMASAVVVRWGGTGAPRVIIRQQQTGDVMTAAYRALVLGLTEARRLRARAVIIYADDADVVAQLDGTERPPGSVLGPYLQVRALLNAFRSAHVRHSAAPETSEAVFAAAAAFRRRRSVYSDLPLWAAAS